jgi:hypothetical protein
MDRQTNITFPLFFIYEHCFTGTDRQYSVVNLVHFGKESSGSCFKYEVTICIVPCHLLSCRILWHNINFRNNSSVSH